MTKIMINETLKLALEALEAMQSYAAAERKGLRICDEAITALREALAEQPAQQEPKIDMYRSFEQWKIGNVLEHGVPRTEYYNEAQLDLVEMGWNYGYEAGRAVEQALDKMAENARELGLDYEPEQEPVETYIHEFTKHPHPGDFGIPRGHWWQAKNYADVLYTAPPQRKPLTDEQFALLYMAWQAIGADIMGLKWSDFVEEIGLHEAKLKEKNT